MGDRANVHMTNSGVYLYTHWHGTYLPQMVKDALVKRWRWNDESYLTRIIFDVMTADSHGSETGFGISSSPPDGADRIVNIDCDAQQIAIKHRGAERRFTFEEYVALPDGKCEWTNED